MPDGPVVNQLGFGLAQWIILLLGSGAVDFCDGIEIVLVNLVAVSTAKEFNLGDNIKPLLTTVTFAALCVGIYGSGRFGDTFGRRIPTLLSLLGTAILGLICAVMPTYLSMMAARSILGVFMGFGMTPSAALITEVTPAKFRIVMRAASKGLSNFGGICICLAALFDDPNLTTLNWRKLMIVGAIFPAIFFVASYIFLPESPAFLASIGKESEARECVHKIGQLNGQVIDANLDLKQLVSQQTEAAMHWTTIFTHPFMFTTAAMTYLAFIVNVAQSGDSYAAPQILMEMEGGSPAAVKMLMKTTVTTLFAVACGLVSMRWSREFLMMLSFALLSASLCLFAVFASIGLNAVASISSYCISCCAMSCTVFVYQQAVEIYPTAITTTGGAFIMGGGRIGAVVASLVVENFKGLTGYYDAFYYFVAGLCALGAVLAQLLPRLEPDEKHAQVSSYGSIDSRKPCFVTA